VVFAGLPGIYESEGYDRENMSLPAGHNRLIEALAGLGKKIVVVLLGGAVMELPWADQVQAILYMGLSGQAGAGAVLDILSGRTNPSGKLSETWPIKYEDVVSSDYYIKGNRDAQYREGIYVGYRYYEKAGVRVRYPFGYGLSYTRFLYDNLYFDRNTMTLRVDVMNVGGVAGKEITLLYVRNPEGRSYRAVRELRGFTKTYLEVGEKKTLSFVISDRDFSVWDDGWKVAGGTYGLEIVGNAAEVSGSTEVQVDGDAYMKELPEWYFSLEGRPSEEDFVTLYGRAIPKREIRPYNINSNIADMLEGSFIIRQIYGAYERSQAKQFGRGTVDYKGMMIMADECPLRSVQNNLLLKGHVAEALADLGNKRYLKMIGHLIK